MKWEEEGTVVKISYVINEALCNSFKSCLRKMIYGNNVSVNLGGYVVNGYGKFDISSTPKQKH